MRNSHLLIFALMFIALVSCNKNKNNNNNNSDNTDSLEQAIDTGDLSSMTDTADLPSPEDLVESKDIEKLNQPQIRVQELLAHCAKNDYQSASTILAYLGGDENRLYSDHFNYSSSSEKSTVDITCDIIADWLGESESYEFISYSKAPGKNGMELHSVEVMFKKQELGINRRFFELIETQKGFLLVSLR